ncbi:MAG: hypothetical protein IJ587_12405, partial [Synergistaceae bacterium]|nr:hypothetical protein [Synergistaceae bacterium]
MADITAFKPVEEGGFLTPLEHVSNKNTDKPDTLKLEYPAMSGLIDSARLNGKDDTYIRRELARRESISALYHPQNEINKYLGRTKQTNDALYDAVQNEEYSSYAEAMRHILPKDRVIDIVNTAKYSGFAPSFLLSNHANSKLIEAAEKIAGERKSAFGQVASAFRNMAANYLQGKAERNRFLAEGTREGVNDSDIPGFMRTIRHFEGDEAVLAEREKIAKYAEQIADWQEATADKMRSHVRPPDSAIGQMFISAIENGGFTIESSLISALAWAFGGAPLGLAAAAFNTKTEAETEAGGVFSEAMRRGLAKGLSYEQAALEAYQTAKGVRNNNLALLPLTNYGGDFLLHGTADFFRDAAAEFIPGGGLLRKAARGFIRIAAPALLDSFPETLEEYSQEYFQMDALRDNIDNKRLIEAAKMGFVDSLIYSSVGLGAKKALRLNSSTDNNQANKRVQSFLNNTVRDLYKLEEQYENGEINDDTIVDNDPVVFLPKSRIDEQTAQALGINDNEVIEDEEGNIIENQKSTESSLNDRNDGIEEAENAEPLKNEDEEIAVRQSVWEQFASDYPQKALELQDVLRPGVQGVTYREQAARKLDTLRQAFEDNSELVEEVKRVEREATESGRDAEQARKLSVIAGVVANSMNKQYGTNIHTAMNLAFRSAAQNGEAINTAGNAQTRENFSEAKRRGTLLNETQDTDSRIENYNQTANGENNADANTSIQKSELRPQFSKNIKEAASDELIVRADGSPVLGYIDSNAAQALGTQEGEIYA